MRILTSLLAAFFLSGCELTTEEWQSRCGYLPDRGDVLFFRTGDPVIFDGFYYGTSMWVVSPVTAESTVIDCATVIPAEEGPSDG